MLIATWKWLEANRLGSHYQKLPKSFRECYCPKNNFPGLKETINVQDLKWHFFPQPYISKSMLINLLKPKKHIFQCPFQMLSNVTGKGTERGSGGHKEQQRYLVGGRGTKLGPNPFPIIRTGSF